MKNKPVAIVSCPSCAVIVRALPRGCAVRIADKPARAGRLRIKGEVAFALVGCDETVSLVGRSN